MGKSVWEITYLLKLSPHIPRIRIVVLARFDIPSGGSGVALLFMFCCIARILVTDLPFPNLPLGLRNIFTNSFLLPILHFKELAYTVATLNCIIRPIIMVGWLAPMAKFITVTVSHAFLCSLP